MDVFLSLADSGVVVASIDVVVVDFMLGPGPGFRFITHHTGPAGCHNPAQNAYIRYT
jgi:hypothetical protein